MMVLKLITGIMTFIFGLISLGFTIYFFFYEFGGDSDLKYILILLISFLLSLSAVIFATWTKFGK